MSWKSLSIITLWITCQTNAQTAVAPAESPLPKPSEIIKPSQKKDEKKKSSKKKKIHSKYTLNTKIFFALLAILIIGSITLLYYYKTNQNPEESYWTFYTINLSDTIPPLERTAKDQYTYNINKPDDTFYANCNEEELKSKRGLLKTLLKAVKEQEKDYQIRKLTSTIDINYDIFDVPGDGHCCTYVSYACQIYQAGYSEKTHKDFVKKIKKLRKQTIASYKELMAGTSPRAQKFLKEEKTIRLKEAHIKFLYSADQCLALLDEIKNKKIKSFKKKLELMNRLPRKIISDFIRAGMMIVLFHANDEKFIQEKKYLDREQDSYRHLLDSNCWLDPIDEPLVHLLRALDIGYPAFRKDNQFCSIDWPATVMQDGIPTLTYTEYDEARMKYGMKVIAVSKNGNHYQIAIHPALMKEA